MKIFKKIVISVLLLGLFSCTGDLVQLPKTNITEPNYYKTAEQIIKASNAMYMELAKMYRDKETIAYIGGMIQGDNATIKASASSAAATSAQRLDVFDVNSSNVLITQAWQGAYHAIYICNNIIQTLRNTKVSFSNPNLKERLIAEATTIRAFIFFHLVRIWGAIPMPLEPLTASEAFEAERVDINTVYNQIINDLKMAKNVLPEKYTGKNVGRITKYAAAAILAKVYITRGRNENAKNELNTIIQSNVYSLDSNSDGVANKKDYVYIFQPNTKNSGGSILEAQFFGGPNGFNSNLQHFLGQPWDQRFHLPGVEATSGKGGFATPSKSIMNAFEPEDNVRDSISTVPGFYTLGSNNFVGKPYTLKYYDPNFRNEGQNIEIIRYAEILLMYSALTNDPFYLNKVRARVGLAGYGEAGYPSNKYNTFEEAVAHERRVELSFEFHRYYYLKREGKALEVMRSMGYSIEEYELLLPIPQHVIDVNGLEQNPGY